MRAGTLVLAALLILVAALPATAQVVVDDFSTAQALLDAPPTDSSSVGPDGSILGMQRDLLVERRSGTGTVTAEVTGGALSFTVPATDSGAVTLTWDGDTDPGALDPVGLGGVDLTTGGATAFRFTAGVTTSASSVLVRVHTDGFNSSKGALLLPVGASGDSFLAFDDFEVATGTGADFADVGAIEVTILEADGGVALELFDVVTPAVTASKADVVAGGTAEPGETIEYRVTLGNTGGTAEGTTFEDTVDSNTTSPGTFRSTPLARDDAYASFGNLTLAVPEGPDDLLVNDQDFDGDAVAAVAVLGQVTTRGGTVDVAADGSFTYTPPAGFVGVDTFTYAIDPVPGDPTVDAGGNPIGPVTATATIDLSNVIWFVDDDHCVAPCGSGTQADPFGDFSQLNGDGGTGDVDGPGDLIYVRTGSGSTDTGDAAGFELEDTQQLLGEGVALVVGGVEIVPAGTHPVLTNIVSPAGIGITLASDNTIRGLDIGSTDGMGLKNAAMASVGTLTIDDLEIGGAGGVMNLDGGGTLAVTFDSLESTSSATRGISLSSVSGSFTVTGGTTIDDSTGTAIFVTGSDAALDFGATSLGQSTAVGQGIDLASSGSATFTFASLAITTDAGLGLRVNTAGTVSIGGAGNTVAATGGPALDVSATTMGAAWTFASLSSSGSGAEGILLDGLTQSLTVTGPTTISGSSDDGIHLVSNDVTIDFQGGGSSITGAGGTAFRIGDGTMASGGTGNATWAGSITNTAGRSVSVDHKSGGTATFSGAIDDDGTGILLDTNPGATIAFTGGLDLDTTTNEAFAAIGGGTVTVESGAVSTTIDTTTGDGVRIANTAIGGTGVTFDSVSTNGAANGIQLASVGSNAFTVSGGTIQGATNRGVDLDGSNGAVTIGASIANTAGRSVEVTNRTGGTATFNGTVTDTGTGLRVDGNSTGSPVIDFNGAVSSSTGGSTAVTASSNGGATVRFDGGLDVDTTSADGMSLAGTAAVHVTGGTNTVNTTGGTGVQLNAVALMLAGGGLDVTTSGAGHGVDATGGTVAITGGGLDVATLGTGTGFRAVSGGTVSMTGTGNTVSTSAGTGVGVDIADTVIGASGTTFRSVSVNGAANGIILDSTGSSGGFTVTGDAGTTANGSGGLLTNTTGSAILLTDTMGVALDQLNMSNVPDHGVAGIRVNGLSVRNATFTNLGDADGEDVFSFDRDTLGDNGIVGTVVFQNLTITNFAERAIDIVNEGSGTLDLDVLNMSADNNNDTFGEDAIRVQTEGSVNADVLVSGGTYDDLELDVLAYFAQGTGTNTVTVTDVTSINGGGPDNNPNGGGVAIIGSAGSTTSFDIHANNLTGVQGAVIQIIGLAGAGQAMTLNGTIGGNLAADANILTSDNADGIDLDFDGDPGGGSAIHGTILVRNNTIDFEDDGIGIDHRDAAGTMNVTIRDNILTGVAGDDASTADIDDGIFVFTDDDVGAAVNQLNVEVVDNEINNVAATNNIIEIVDVRDGNKICFAATGTSITSGAGNIELDTDAAADLVVDATSAANLSALNNGISVVEAATPTYNSGVDCIP